MSDYAVRDDEVEGVAWGEVAKPGTDYGNEPPPRDLEQYEKVRGLLVPRPAAVRLRGDLWDRERKVARYVVEATIGVAVDRRLAEVRSITWESVEGRILKTDLRRFPQDEILLRAVARVSLTDRQNVDFMVRPERIVEDDPGSGLSYEYVREAATWGDMGNLRWSDMPDGVTWGDLAGRPTLIDGDGIPWWPIRGIHDEHLRNLDKAKRHRLSEEHYREVGEVYRDAKANGKPTTEAIETYFARKEGEAKSRKTVERWITAARKRGYLDATDK